MYGINVMYTSCDNVGKKGDFERACKQEGMGV